MQKVILIDADNQTLDAKVLYKELYENAEALVCLIKHDKVIDVNTKCLVFFGYEDSYIDKLVLLDNIYLLIESSDSYDFTATTKLGLEIRGKILKSGAVNNDFYFGFLEISFISGLDDYAVAIDKISKTLLALKKFHSPGHNYN